MATLARLAAEGCRLQLLRGLEESLEAAGYRCVAGVDEAGRGCLAGPVVVAAVIADPCFLVPGVDDSKRLDPAARERLAPWIRRTARAWTVTAASAARIDSINILEATREAMLRAVRALRPEPDAVIADAMKLPELAVPVLPLVRADLTSYAVACASILAKVTRDHLMRALDADFPGYGFADHKGYGAPEHLDALRRLGPTKEHRLTFASVVPRRQDAA